VCVIIAKPSNVASFDKDDINSASSVNPDGWGVSYVEDGILKVHRVFNKDGNDPNEINEWFEKLKDKEAVFHLRFSTAGAKNEENCHPFLITLSDKEQIAFHHNGTISETGADSSRSDTKWVADEILPPLLVGFVDPETGLLDIHNHALHFILTKIAGSGSKFALHSNLQGVLLINSKSGDTRHGCWVSNTYSFNAYHRTKYGVYEKGVSKGAVAPFHAKTSTAKISEVTTKKETHTNPTLSGGSKDTAPTVTDPVRPDQFNKTMETKLIKTIPTLNEYLMSLYPDADPDDSLNFAAYTLSKVDLDQMGKLGIDDLTLIADDHPEIVGSILFSLLRMAQDAYFAEFIYTEEDFDKESSSEPVRKVA
jgi:hypothetical protein